MLNLPKLLVRLSDTLNLPERNNAALANHTKRALRTFESNDPHFPLTQIFIHDAEAYLISLFDKIFFSFIIAAIIAICIIVFFSRFPPEASLILSVLIVVIGFALITAICLHPFTPSTVDADILTQLEELESNRLNITLCSF